MLFNVPIIDRRMYSNVPTWTLVLTFLLGLVYADDSAVRLVTSRLNAAELQKVKYQIGIQKPLPPSTATQPTESERLTLRSSNGVVYQCSVPSFADDDDETAGGDSSVLSSMMRQYNFTDIHAKVNRTMNFFKAEGLCIYKNLGWWTYEFCYGKLVSQFHIQGTLAALNSAKLWQFLAI